MTEQQIMKHLYALADFVYGETFSTHDKYEDVRCVGSLFRIYKKDNEVLNEVKNRLVVNPWHTHTPTEEGWYLLHVRGTIPFRVAYMRNWQWLSTDDSRIRTDVVIEWQKIEENEDGRTD